MRRTTTARRGTGTTTLARVGMTRGTVKSTRGLGMHSGHRMVIGALGLFLLGAVSARLEPGQSGLGTLLSLTLVAVLLLLLLPLPTSETSL
jgi:hypothetical protein